MRTKIAGLLAVALMCVCGVASANIVTDPTIATDKGRIGLRLARHIIAISPGEPGGSASKPVDSQRTLGVCSCLIN